MKAMVYKRYGLPDVLQLKDVAASRSLFDYKRALKPTGIYVMLGYSTLLLFQMLCIAPWVKSSSPYNRENKR